MKETTPAAMPLCFERWCKRFDDIWTHQAQKRGRVRRLQSDLGLDLGLTTV